MSTETQTLTAWLEQQIAADEAAARGKGADAMTGHRWKHAPENVYQELQGEVLANCRRVLAQCAAFRAIVALHEPNRWGWCIVCTEEPGTYDNASMDSPCPTLRAVAQIYRDRPGWQEAWA